MEALVLAANDHTAFMALLNADQDVEWTLDASDKYPFEHSGSIALLEDLQNFAFADTNITMRVSDHLAVLRAREVDTTKADEQADAFERGMRKAFVLSDVPGVKPGEGPNWARRMAKLRPKVARKMCECCKERVADMTFTPCMHTLYCMTCVIAGNLAMMDDSPFCYICIKPSEVAVHPDSSNDPKISELVDLFGLSISMKTESTKKPEATPAEEVL